MIDEKALVETALRACQLAGVDARCSRPAALQATAERLKEEADKCDLKAKMADLEAYRQTEMNRAAGLRMLARELMRESVNGGA